MSLELATSRLGKDVMDVMGHNGWVYEGFKVMARHGSDDTFPIWGFSINYDGNPEFMKTAQVLRLAAHFMEKE